MLNLALKIVAVMPTVMQVIKAVNSEILGEIGADGGTNFLNLFEHSKAPSAFMCRH